MTKENPNKKPFKPLFKQEEIMIPTDIPRYVKPSQLVIIGGGTSLKEGIQKGLWNRMIGKYTIGLNHIYKYFPRPTIQSYVDIDFYNDEYKNLKDIPLIIGKYHYNLEHMEKKAHPNTIMLQCIPNYHRDLKDGIYKDSLVGLFALSLAIKLLDKGEIFLLGYDYGSNGAKDKLGRKVTHFNQGEINHTGMGKVDYYETIGRANKDFGVYAKEEKVKIYNVSLNSKILTFPKISYDEFFNKLKDGEVDQDRIRREARQKLKEITL